MVIFTERLPNGNVFMWLGTGIGWKESESGIDNALVLTGGDVLLLKTAGTIPLHNKEIVEDLKNLDFTAFCEKHSLNDLNYDLWKELHYGLERSKYPIIEHPESEIFDYEDMIKKYMSNLNLEHLRKIKRELDRKIMEEEIKLKKKEKKWFHETIWQWN